MKRPKSSKPRIQRKFLRDGDLHLLRKNLVLHISKTLKEKLNLGIKRILAKSGLKVRIIKGKFKGKEGSLAKVNIKKQKIYVEGVSHRNSRGREKLIPIAPSNVEVIDEKIKEFLGGKKLVKDVKGEKTKADSKDAKVNEIKEAAKVSTRIESDSNQNNQN
ncbi:MAG: 50S ribosomal protein L24 [Candidatus Anstonellales archaeon]